MHRWSGSTGRGRATTSNWPKWTTELDGKPDADDPCGKAVTVAKNVVTKLPKA